MAQVTLDDVWFHLPDQPSSFVRATLTSEREITTRSTQVRNYAAGRRRAITRPGTSRTLFLGLDLAERVDIVQLQAWEGAVVMLRDPRGRKLWGIYDGLTVDELSGQEQVANVTLVFVEVTWDEAI